MIVGFGEIITAATATGEHLVAAASETKHPPDGRHA
jgi:hypothetical protein